jgi:hypothetical protein
MGPVERPFSSSPAEGDEICKSNEEERIYSIN